MALCKHPGNPPPLQLNLKVTLNSNASVAFNSKMPTRILEINKRQIFILHNFIMQYFRSHFHCGSMQRVQSFQPPAGLGLVLIASPHDLSVALINNHIEK